MKNTVLFCLILSCCFNPKNALPFKKFDSTILLHLNAPYVSDTLPDYSLTRKDLRHAERVLKLAFDKEISPNRPGEPDDKNLGKYVRQYYGYRNTKGERCAFVQCTLKSNLLGDKTYWRQVCFILFDGGDSTFRVWINLDRGNYEDFEMNGLG